MLSKFLSVRKIAIIIFFFFLISCLLSQSTRAFYTPDSTYQFQFEQAVYGMSDEMNLQSFVYETLKAVMGSIITTISGPILHPEARYQQSGLIKTIGGTMALLYATPPASGIEYLADIGRKLNFVQPTYAQEGLGFKKMDAYLEIWSAFRNITYVFFVLILVIMGFAIMFRIKINPQTVITIQSALPRVVIALILITFSYAIVGLLIDFMFVAANLVFFTLSDMTHFADVLSKVPHFGADLKITSDVKAFGIMYLGFLQSWHIFLLFIILPSLLGASIVAPFTFGASTIVVGSIDLLLVLIVGIILLVALIRILWSLIKAYVMVVLQLIFAPFIILVGVLPGSNAITSWFRNLIANLAVFPAILTMIFIANALIYKAVNLVVPLEAMIQFLLGEIVFTDLVPQFHVNLENTGEALVLSFITFGILLLTPRVADMIKSFMAGKPFEYGTAIGEAFGPVTRPAAGLVGFGMSTGQDLARTAITQRVFPSTKQAISTTEGTGEVPPSSAPRRRTSTGGGRRGRSAVGPSTGERRRRRT